MGKVSSFFVVLIVAVAVNGSGPLNQKLNSIKGRLFTPAEGCGTSESSSVTRSRIVGGVPAQNGQFAWMTMLGYGVRSSGKVSFRCGGTLITSINVLTAAHCIDPDLYIARLGEYDYSTKSDGESYDVEVAYSIPHKGYNKATTTNDIALLKLKDDVYMTDRIRPICLPITKESRARNLDHLTPFVAGWGTTSAGGSVSHVMRYVQLPVVKNENCLKAYAEAYKMMDKPAIDPTRFNNNVMCAGTPEGGKDSCQGDSGGPLMAPFMENGKSHVYQIGVVSWGIGCGTKGIPGVYTRVSSYMDWIQENLLL